MASVSVLQRKVNDCKKKIKTWKGRKTALEKVQKRLERDFDDNVSDVRRQCDGLLSGLSSGLRGDGLRGMKLNDSVEWNKEPQTWQDSRLSSAESSLDAEIRRCKEEISDLEGQLRTLECQLREAKEAERRARLEAMTALLG